jgi:hypothetical protein
MVDTPHSSSSSHRSARYSAGCSTAKHRSSSSDCKHDVRKRAWDCWQVQIQMRLHSGCSTRPAALTTRAGTPSGKKDGGAWQLHGGEV